MFQKNNSHWECNLPLSEIQLIKLNSEFECGIAIDTMWPSPTLPDTSALWTELMAAKQLSLHYRLRCSIGFWNEQKMDKSRCLYAKIMVNVQKSLKGASVRAEFLFDEKIDHAKKKSSKYRVLLRPPSWWNWTSKITNIVLQISVHKLFASKISFI